MLTLAIVPCMLEVVVLAKEVPAASRFWPPSTATSTSLVGLNRCSVMVRDSTRYCLGARHRRPAWQRYVALCCHTVAGGSGSCGTRVLHPGWKTHRASELHSKVGTVAPEGRTPSCTVSRRSSYLRHRAFGGWRRLQGRPRASRTQHDQRNARTSTAMSVSASNGRQLTN